MFIDRFFSIVAAILNSFGAIFVFVGTFRLITSDLGARLATTPYMGFDLNRLRSLSRQKGYTVSGLILISAALLSQALPLVLIQEPWEILGGHDRLALTLALCVGMIPVLVVFRQNLLSCRRTEEQAKRAEMKNRLVRALNQNPFRRTHWNTVVEDAETLLHILPPPKSEPIDLFLRKLARELGVNFPIGLQIEDEQTRSTTHNSAKATGV